MQASRENYIDLSPAASSVCRRVVSWVCPWSGRRAGPAAAVRVRVLAGAGAALVLTASALPAAESPNSDDVQIPEVSVVAEPPGPALWKVSTGPHTVWIMGTVPVLPKKLSWRAVDVERVLATAQEVIPSDPNFDLGLNPFSASYRYFQWLHLRVLPHGQTLHQVLPPQLYQRFAAVRSRYTRDADRFERLQPMLAGAELWQAAMDSSGLELSANVEAHIMKLARQHRVPVKRYHVDLRDTGEVMKELGALSVAEQVQCLEPMLQLLESHVPDIERRAKAWSSGDIDTFSTVAVPDPSKGCGDAVAGAASLTRAGRDAHDGWTHAVEDALAHDASSLAIQEIDSLLGPDGWLEELRTAGYTVEGPLRPPPLAAAR